MNSDDEELRDYFFRPSDFLSDNRVGVRPFHADIYAIVKPNADGLDVYIQSICKEEFGPNLVSLLKKDKEWQIIEDIRSAFLKRHLLGGKYGT